MSDSKRILGIIDEAAKRHGVNPDTLKIVARIESSLNPNAVGSQTRSGVAKGLFQFVPATAKAYGLDDPMDAVKSADAAARYVKDLGKQYGDDLPTMLAQYNGGNAGARNAKQGKVFAETYDYFNKYNKYAKELGLASRIPVSDYTPIERPKKTPSPRSAAPVTGFMETNGTATTFNTKPNTAELERKASEQRFQDEQDTVFDDAADFGSAAMAGAKAASLPVQAFLQLRDVAVDSDKPDPVWKQEATTDNLIKRLTEEGVDRDQWDYVLQGAESREGFNTRLERIADAKKEQAIMARSPAGAIMGSFVGGALDPSFWASGYLGAIAGGAVKAGKVGRALAGAAAGGAADAAVSATLGEAVDPNYTSTDVIINGLAGSLVGALGGIAKGNPRGRVEDDVKDAPEVDDLKEVPGEEVQQPPVNPPAPPREDPPEEGVNLDDLEVPEEAVEVVNDIDQPVNPPAPPRNVPWDESWDTPERGAAFERGGEKGDTLLVPPDLDWKGTAQYIIKFGNDRERSVMELLVKRMGNVRVAKFGKDTNGKVVALDKGGMTTGQLDAYKLDIENELKNPKASQWAAWAYPATRNNSGKFTSVQYYKNTDRTSTNKGAFSAETFIHESMHSATSRWTRLADDWKQRGNLTPEEAGVVKAVDELREVFNNMRNTAKNLQGKNIPLRERVIGANVRAAYGFTNIDEFMAELASTPFESALAKLQRTVEDMEAGGQNVEVKSLRANLKRAFDSVVKLLKKIFTGKDAGEYVDGYRAAVLKVLDATTKEADAAVKAKKPSMPEPMGVANKKRSAIKSIEDLRELKEPPTMEQVLQAYNGGVTFGKGAGGFGIEHILQNPKMPEAIRALGAKLVGSTAGYRGGEVVGRNAWDDAVTLRKTMAAKYIKGHHFEFKQWFIEQRRAGKYDFTPWGEEQGLKEFGEEVYDNIVGIATSTDPYVLKAVAANRAFFLEWNKFINNPGQDEGLTIRGLTERTIEYVDPETGELVKKVSDPLPDDPNYVPFSLNVQKMNELFAKYGDEQVHKFFEEAFYSGNPALREVMQQGGKDYGKMFSRWYLKQILDSKVNRKFDYIHSLETSASGDELVQGMIDAGINADDAAQIVKGLLEGNAGTKAFNSSLRRRATYDRKFAMTFDDGTTLKVYDFVERDVARLAAGYNNRMAGAVALAKNFDGVHSLSDLKNLELKATSRAFGAGQMTDAQVAEARRAFESAFNHILGRPVDDPSNIKQGLQTLRDVNVVTKMGGAVLYQVAELSQLVGSVGLMNVLRAIPELSGSWVRNKRTGRIASEELDAYEDLIGGAGTDMLEYMDVRMGDEWSSLNGFGSGAQKADAANFGIRKGAAGLLKWTGMTGAMVIEKRLALIAITRHFQDAALNGKPLRYNERRLAFMGLDADAFAAMKAAMVKYSSVDARGRKKLDVRGWAAGDPDTFAKWRVALQRESRRVVQENDLGAHIPALDNGWFKSFTQFRTFVLQAWSKSLLFGINHKDMQTATTLMYGLFFATMTQTARAYLKASSMSEEDAKEHLDKALSLKPGGVLLQGAASISQASLLPQLFDTVSPFGNLFDGYRTTTDSSELFANPSFDLLDRVTGTAKQLAYSASGQDSIDQRDFQQMKGLLPFNTALPVSAALGVFSSGLPKSTKAELLFDPEEE